MGDKSCDVYEFAVSAPDGSGGRLLLGHLSMLLDLQLTAADQLTAGRRFLATCDRDEKIRVSHYPLCQQIRSYCLGHSEFVASCAFVDADRLASGAGDGTVRLWNFHTGRLLAVRDARLDLADRREAPKEASAGRLAVSRVFAVGHWLVVGFFDRPTLALYRVEADRLHCRQLLPLPSAPVELQMLGTRVWLLCQQHGLVAADLAADRLQLASSDWIGRFNQQTSLVAALARVDSAGLYEPLFKSSFDNLEVYYENKKRRQEKQKAI